MAKILMADDAAFMRKVIKDTLSKNGFTDLHEAVDGADAVAKYDEVQPDLVILDITMPKLQDGTELTEEQSQNLDLIMSVPLEIAVEIGRTRKKVQEIVSLSKGSLVVLDKLAGDQVDVYVNGKCIAQGDVVVIDDNFGIRITEILRRPGLEDFLL